MKLLYLTPAFQHPIVRGPTRCYHFTKELCDRHEITMMTLIRSEIPNEAFTEMKSYVKKIYTFNAMGDSSNGKNGNGVSKKVKTSMSVKSAVKEMREAFLDLVKKESFDAVLFHGKSIYSVIEGFDDLPIVIDFCDATSMRIKDRMKFDTFSKRIMLKRRYKNFREIEQKMINKTPHVAFISCRDRDANMENRDGIRIVPIGVDLDFWKRRTNEPQKNTLVFTGVMNYRPNEDAAHYLIDKILPLVRPYVPDLEVLIVGRDPTEALVEKGKKFDDVTVTGFVDDVRDYLEKASIFVAPVRYASGIQNKVLEAFAMELPVICTTAVAEGLKFDDADETPIHVANDPKPFADKVVNLLSDDNERRQLAEEGRRFVERHFIWAKNAEVLEKMCEDAIAGVTV